jgi:hypothetical protein
MARVALTPTLLTADSSATSLSGTVSAQGTVTTGASNGCTFSNAPLGQVLLIVNATANGTAGTATVFLGQTIGSQSFTSFSVPLTNSALNVIGPFHAALDTPGTTTVTVDFTFTGASTITVGVVQIPGVY